MISMLDRWCNWDNENRPAIATRINSLSSLLLENIGSPTKQWFADNLRHLPLPPVTPSDKVESSAYPEGMITAGFHFVEDIERRPKWVGNFAKAKGRIMKAYILRDKEAEEEVKKAKKAKNQGQWIRGSWERQANGGLKWIRPKFIPGPAA
jgi:hypothetical protein